MPLRLVAFIAIALLYWLVASGLILTAMIGTCGMGPDALCSNGGPLSAAFAFVGFAAVFFSFTLVFFRRKSTGHP